MGEDGRDNKIKAMSRRHCGSLVCTSIFHETRHLTARQMRDLAFSQVYHER